MHRWALVSMSSWLITGFHMYRPDGSSTACALIIAFATGLSYLLSLMYSVQDYSTLGNTQTGLPLAEIFHQATQSQGGAFALIILLWIALCPCVIGAQLGELF